MASTETAAVTPRLSAITAPRALTTLSTPSPHSPLSFPSLFPLSLALYRRQSLAGVCEDRRGRSFTVDITVSPVIRTWPTLNLLTVVNLTVPSALFFAQ